MQVRRVLEDISSELVVERDELTALPYDERLYDSLQIYILKIGSRELKEVFADKPEFVFGSSCNSGPLGGDAEIVALMAGGIVAWEGSR